MPAVRIDDFANQPVSDIIWCATTYSIGAYIIQHLYKWFSMKHRSDILDFEHNNCYKTSTWKELNEMLESDFSLIINWLEYVLLTVNFEN